MFYTQKELVEGKDRHSFLRRKNADADIAASPFSLGQNLPGDVYTEQMEFCRRLFLRQPGLLPQRFKKFFQPGMYAFQYLQKHVLQSRMEYIQAKEWLLWKTPEKH